MKLSLLATVSFIVFACAFSVAAQPGDPTDFDMDGQPGVAEPPEEPYPPIPSIVNGAGVLLVDRSHGGDFDVSGFTSFLASEGWSVAEHDGAPLTASILAGRDVLMIPMRASAASLTAFTEPEIEAIRAFLADGHGLWVLSDFGDPTGTNTLSHLFDVVFQPDIVFDPSDNEGEFFWPTLHEIRAHAVTSAVETYGYYLGCCLFVENQLSVVARGDYDAASLRCMPDERPPALVVWENVGRAVFAGDDTPLHPNWYPERLRPEEQTLLQNIANWLLGPPPNVTETATWGRIKVRFK